MKNSGHRTEAETLRAKAEELMKMKPSKADSSLSLIETVKLIHELEVHQIELELENNELILARSSSQEVAEKYTELYDLAPSGYFTVSPEGEVLNVNLCGAQMLGKERSLLPGSRFDHFVSKDTRPIFYLFLERVFINKSKEACEVTLTTNGNLQMYLHLTGITAGNGRQCLMTAVDITERRKAEQALVKSEYEFRLLAEAMPQLVWITRPDGWNIYFNQQWVDYSGLTLEESYGHGWNKQFHPDDRQQALDAWQNATKQGANYALECRLRRADGAYKWWLIRGVPVLDADGTVLKWYGTCTDIEDIKRSAAELIKVKEDAEESKNRFQSIFFGAPAGIGVVKDRVITEVNPKLLEITGYNQGDLVGQSSLKLYPSKEEFDYVGKEKYRQIGETGSGTVETKWRKKDGTIIDVLLSSSVIFPGDYHRGVAFTAFDISSSKMSEAMFRDIVEKNPLSIQILNLEGYTIQTNSAHTRLFGAIPPPDYSIFKDTQLLEQGLGELFEQIKNGEIVHFPDSYFNAHDVEYSFPNVLAWIKATGFALNDSNGVPERIVLMHENITVRKHLELMFQDIIDKNPMSIQLVDKDGITITGNPAYLKLFGSLPPPGFSIFADLQSKSPEFERLISLAKRGEVVHLPDINYNPKDVSADSPDNPVWIRALIFPINDIKGKPDRFVLMHENITERKQTENEIRLLNETLEHRIAERTIQLETANKELAFRVSELEQFSYVSNHDLQEPLRTLIQFTQLLNEKCAGMLDEDGEKYIEFISKSAMRMKVLVKDLLDYSLLGKESVKTIVDCNKIVKVVLGDLEDSTKGRCANLTVQELPTFNGYETELRLLFQNLVGNAIKYQKPDTVPEINISAESHEKDWLFSIRDNGIGIDKKYNDKIFIIFQRLHNRSDFEGTGIGLAHCKKIVEMHGGKIWVESTPGQGSVFMFTIPK
jgi:PAS domain S-box-containing protein